MTTVKSQPNEQQQQITLAITGASGVVYALRLMQVLLQQDFVVHTLISSAAQVVFATEMDLQLPSHPERLQAALLEYFQQQGISVHTEQIKVYGKNEWFSPVASGSSAPKRMVVCPCSTGTLSAIATGASDNLIERGADVVLKERGQLILVPRETPYNQIHLEHMLKLTQMGAVVLPASPGFYQQPTSIQDVVDFVVARILEHLCVPQDLMHPWGYKPQESPLSLHSHTENKEK